MRLEDELRLAVPVETAWSLLVDLARVAPCLPGARLEAVEAGEYRGVVEVRLGAVRARYRGSARLDAVDEANRRAVLRAVGRDPDGAGNASATVSASLRPDGDGTVVRLETDLAVSGKVARLSREVLAETSERLLTELGTNLEREVLAPSPSPTPEPVHDLSTDGLPRGGGEAAASDPVDLVEVAGGPALRRALPWAVVILAVVIVWRWRRRRRVRRTRAERAVPAAT